MRALLAPLSRWLDRRIDARIAADEAQQRIDREVAIRRTWAGFSPAMRAVFGSEEGFRRVVTGGVMPGATSPNTLLAPTSECVVSEAGLAAEIRAKYRPGGSSYAETLHRRLTALEHEHAKLAAYCGPEAARASLEDFISTLRDPAPKWPKAMRTDASSRAKDGLPVGLRPFAEATAAEIATIQRVYARTQRGGDWMGA